MAQGETGSALRGTPAERRLRRLLLLLIIVIAIRNWAWMPMVVVGNSMLPTLHGGQIAFVNKIAYRFSPPQRGDLVAVNTGEDLIIKRIVGMPGEEISNQCGTFFINGRPLDEPYVQTRDRAQTKLGRLPDNTFVIAGDNRGNTIIALVSKERIVGRLAQPRQRPAWSTTVHHPKYRGGN